MREREEIIAAVIAAAGGELIGKVRLQKVVYLLDQLGLESGFRFEYHHYGPFSRVLVNGVEDAKAFHLLEETSGQRNADLARYSIFRLAHPLPTTDDSFGAMTQEKAEELAKNLVARDATVLELAATIHWLWKFEGRSNWRDELIRRKGPKIQNGRLERAISLLEDLSLTPPQIAH